MGGMQVIVLASQKGGAGKTTLSRHLAVEAERVGEGPVALIDADPQGGLARWWNRRAAETPIFVSSTLEALPENIERLRKAGFRHVFLDTPPQATALIRDVVRLADLVIIPARPSPDDLDALGATIDIVEGEGKPLVFVINSATRKARLTGQAAIVLSQHGTVAPAIIHRSDTIPASGIAGQTVVEVDPKSSPAQEIAELWAYLSSRLSRGGTGIPSKPAKAPRARKGPSPHSHLAASKHAGK
jgi:chromosome partitioning protein